MLFKLEVNVVSPENVNITDDAPGPSDPTLSSSKTFLILVRWFDAFERVWVEMGREQEGHDVRRIVDALRTICDKMVLSAGHIRPKYCPYSRVETGFFRRTYSCPKQLEIPNPQLSAPTTVWTDASTVNANIAQKELVSLRFILFAWTGCVWLYFLC